MICESMCVCVYDDGEFSGPLARCIVCIFVVVVGVAVIVVDISL